MLTSLVLILIIFQLLFDRSSIHKQAGKMCSDRHKDHGCGHTKKKQNALALLYLGLVPLPNTTVSSDVTIEFTAEHNKDDVLEGKFRGLNFLPFTKKATEYCFELFISS